MLYFHKTKGHFYSDKLYQCADKQFFKAFHLPICQHSSKTKVFPPKCVGQIEGARHSHLPAPRENVELMAFRWQARIYILQNSKKDIMDVIKAVYAEWPFKINFYPPRLFKLMGPTLKVYQKYGNAKPNTSDYETGQNVLTSFPQKDLDKFIDHLRTSPDYWTPPQPRKLTHSMVHAEVQNFIPSLFRWSFDC